MKDRVAQNHYQPVIRFVAKRRVTVCEFHSVFESGPLECHFIGDDIHDSLFSMDRKSEDVRDRKSDSAALHQPLPNTEPGLAGETGVSGGSGMVYGPDGLKTGAGVLKTDGGAPPNTGEWIPPSRPLPSNPLLRPRPPLPRPATNACVAMDVPNITTASRIAFPRRIPVFLKVVLNVTIILLLVVLPSLGRRWQRI